MKSRGHTFALFQVDEEHSVNCFLLRGTDVFFPFFGFALQVQQLFCLEDPRENLLQVVFRVAPWYLYNMQEADTNYKLGFCVLEFII